MKVKPTGRAKSLKENNKCDTIKESYFVCFSNKLAK